MPGVPRKLTEHVLNTYKGMNPVKKALHHFIEPKCKAIGNEITLLLTVGFIWEVEHSDWLANPVLMPKKNKS